MSDYSRQRLDAEVGSRVEGARQRLDAEVGSRVEGARQRLDAEIGGRYDDAHQRGESGLGGRYEGDYPGARRELDGLFELTAAFVGSATRLGLQVASAPLILLPRGSRRRVRRAMGEVARAVVALPRELTDVSVRVVDDIFTGDPTAPRVTLPSSERVGERARAFSERLGRAADEFGTAVGRATDRAADEVERTAARVDEWVETPPRTPRV